MGVLGPRSRYQYQGDDGTIYKMNRRNADMDAIGNDHAAASVPPLPGTITPRRVFFKGVDGSRKHIDVSDVGNTFYQSGGTLTVDGIVYTATGRLGERDRGGLD